MFLASPEPASRTVELHPPTLLLNGKLEIVFSASVPYAQIPSQLWADRIMRLRQCGINTVVVPVSWAAHEPEPGTFSFDGNHDLGAFLDECSLQGMSAIVEAGPYLGADGGTGGLPAWLLGVRGIRFQPNHTAYRDALQRWLDQLISVLLPRQWTNGGAVVLIHGDAFSDAAGRRFLHDFLTTRGITVPIIDPDHPAFPFPAPLPDSGTEYSLWRQLAAGGRAFHVPYPLSPSGSPTANGRACRRVALWAQTFGEILLTGQRKDRVPATDGLQACEIATRERGGIVFVENTASERAITGSVIPYLPEITLNPQEAFAWVHDTPIGASHKYLAAYVGLVKSDASILTTRLLPDPFEGARVYVYGEPGTTREVVLFYSVGGESVTVEFTNTSQLYRVGPSQVVALPLDLAARTFFCPTDENAPVIIGPDAVREHSLVAATVEVTPDTRHCLYTLLPDGTLTETWVHAPALPDAPLLSEWQDTIAPYTPDYADSDWQEIEQPTEMRSLGSGNAPYAWYRARVIVDEAMDAEIHFAAFADRLTCGRTANGSERHTQKPGKHRLTFACLPGRICSAFWWKTTVCDRTNGGRGTRAGASLDRSP